MTDRRVPYQCGAKVLHTRWDESCNHWCRPFWIATAMGREYVYLSYWICDPSIDAIYLSTCV